MNNDLIQANKWNMLRIWKSYKDLMNDPYRGEITIRHIVSGSPYCKYNIFQGYILDHIGDLIAAGHANDIDLTMKDFYFNESAPDIDLTIQGEYVFDRIEESVLFYSTDQGKMRDCLARSGKTLMGYGPIRKILRTYMNDESFSEWVRLKHEYPAAVIEFSCYSRELGSLPGRNTIFWEVRNY